MITFEQGNAVFIPAAMNESLNIREEDGQQKVFDPVRKKYVLLTPEENVRQQFIRFLHEHRKVPYGLMAVEHSITYNRMKRRADLVIYNRRGKPVFLAEFKSPAVEITQNELEQAARYNIVLKVPYLFVTNGKRQILCRIDLQKETYCFLSEIPDYDEMSRVAETDLGL